MSRIALVGLSLFLIGSAATISYAEDRLSGPGPDTLTTTEDPITLIDDWQIAHNSKGALPTQTATTTKPAETGLIKKIVSSFTNDASKLDDWRFTSGSQNESRGFMSKALGIGGGTIQMSMSAPNIAMDAGESIGFAVGGANDINNFRENIANNYLPLPTDITHEGLFYDYLFDTGRTESCSELFCPSYTTAVTPDPISGDEEVYLSVGLNSGLKQSDFARKKLNLVVVLDISGSMGSPFNKYYYDRFGNRQETSTQEANKTKMEIANESVVALMQHLENDDRFGMVLFDGNSYVAKPLNLVGETDMKAIADHVLDIVPQGSTNMAAGMREGTKLFNEYSTTDKDEYENRIIFLTDAMPNTGDTSRGGLLGITKDNASDNLHTSFIGIGVDFNTDLVESLTKIRGANYVSVHSSDEFKNRMDDQFEFMVTPLVFDLALSLEGDGYEIEKVYGSPEASAATGQIMYVNTLFPSEQSGGETRGGLVLLKLKKTGKSNKLNLKATYEDRSGAKYEIEKIFTVNSDSAGFDNTGIRKGILLARYANLMQNWLLDERSSLPEPIPLMEARVNEHIGIPVPPDFTHLGQWERNSLPLTVSDPYGNLMQLFSEHFAAEMNAIGDTELSQELEILNTLSK